MRVTGRIRLFLGMAAAIFVIASLIHFGLLEGYEDRGAAIAESVIALVLIAGLLASLARPDSTRRVGILALGFALAGTLVGSTLLLTVGPRTTLDVAIHLVMIVVVATGLIVALRAPIV